MITLNKDYKEMKEQINEIVLASYSITNILDLIDLHADYQSLIDCYYSSGFSLDSLPNFHNGEMISKYADKHSYKLDSKFLKNFFQNQEVHRKNITGAFKNGGRIFNEYLDSDYRKELFLSGNMDMFDISKDREIDILNNFFMETDPSFKEIFNDIRKSNCFYEIFDEQPKDKKESKENEGNEAYNYMGVTYYNSFKNCGNILMHDSPESVEEIATVVHEVAHVYDFLDFNKNFPSISIFDNDHRNIYSEVLSMLYEYKFYEFLLGNSVFTTDTMFTLEDFYGASLEDLNCLKLLTLLPRGEVYKVYNSDVTILKACETLSSKYDIRNIPDDEKSILDFESSMNYGYGFLLANTLINDRELEKKFMSIRDGYFDNQKLIDIGINSDTLEKNLVKNSRKYFVK